MKSLLVTAYVSPDLDGVAGAMAYAEFLNKTGIPARVAFFGELHEEARYVLDRFGIAYPESISDTNAFEQVILVDASDLNGLEGKVPPEKVIEIYDHRKIHEADKFPNAKAQIELVGAAATLIAEKFISQGIEISKESAILVCGAILSNTLNFQAGVTTKRDHVAYAWLNERAGLPEDFWKDLFEAKSDLSDEKLRERIVGDFAHFTLGGKHIGIAQIEMIGAGELVEKREEEILSVLRDMVEEMSLDFVFQSTLELDGAKNYFVTEQDETKVLLKEIFAVEFQGSIAERSGLIMRKQIVPLLKDVLECS